MVETSGTHRKENIYPQVDNAIQFLLDKINEIKRPFYSSNSRKRQEVSHLVAILLSMPKL